MLTAEWQAVRHVQLVVTYFCLVLDVIRSTGRDFRAEFVSASFKQPSNRSNAIVEVESEHATHVLIAPAARAGGEGGGGCCLCTPGEEASEGSLACHFQGVRVVHAIHIPIFAATQGWVPFSRKGQGLGRCRWVTLVAMLPSLAP